MRRVPNPGPGAELIEIHREDIESLPELMTLLRATRVRTIIFCDDLSFDVDDTTYKSLKAVLEGGIEGRPENVIFYATSNRRHLMPRDMMENELDRDQSRRGGRGTVSLSDRFGLWLGFHRCSQDEFLEMVQGYVAHYRVPPNPRHCVRRRWNGRRRADRDRDVSPGSTCKTSRGGSASPSRSRPPRADQALEVKPRSDRVRSLAPYLAARQILRRIDGGRALAHFEVQLRARHVAGLAGLADHLTALDGLALLHVQFAGVRVGGDEAVRVAHQHEIAVTLQFAARVGNDTVFGGLDRVPSGTATLMPSFWPPPDFGPKPWITRPFTGQRKLVFEPLVVPVGVGSGSGSAAGATRFAVGVVF